MQSLVMPHTAVSLLAILAGWVVIWQLIARRPPGVWMPVFLWTAIITSASGFVLPAEKLMPSHIVGTIALCVLVLVLLARHFGSAKGWRWVEAVGIAMSQFFLMFVLVAQGFAKVPSLHVLAPTGQEPPFAIAQGTLMLIFIYLGYKLVRQSTLRAGVVFRG